MLNGKMCVGIIGDDLMCRINPEIEKELLGKPGARPMDFAKKTDETDMIEIIINHTGK